jgi:hypothetical protein
MPDDPFFLPDPPRRFRLGRRAVAGGLISIVMAVVCAAGAWWVARGPEARPPQRVRVPFSRDAAEIIPRLPGDGRPRPPRAAGPAEEDAAALDPAERFRLDRKIDLPEGARPAERVQRPLEAPPVDPDDPSSAALGTPL